MIDEEDITTIDMNKSLLLFSGGLDTTTLLYWLVDEGVPVQCLGFDYGQQATKELEQAKKTCEKLNVKYEIMDLKPLHISGDLGKGGNIGNKVDIIVPNRNSIFLAMATNYAIQHGCNTVYIGSKLGQTACLDEQPEFIEEYNELNKVSDITQVAIKAPLIYMDILAVLDLALSLDVPLVDTWSCFANTDKRCGTCGNCKALPEAIQMKIDEYQKNLDNLNEYISSFPTKKE